MNRLHLDVSESVVEGRSRRVTRLVEDSGARPVELFHELDRAVPLSALTPLDGHALVVLLYAASVGKPLVVHGPVTRTVLRNMEELLLAWNRWKPARYHRIEIIPDRVMDLRPVHTTEAAIAAFSGGVDATFTALRHASNPQALPARTRYPLSSVLMVHGFDVDVYNFADFEKLTSRVQPLLQELGLGFRVIRTNSRDVRLQDWDDSSGLELAGCMHMYAQDFRHGLIGSTKSYDALVLPWGSNPVTDHLMSGDRFTIIHDGAGYSRTEKAALISKHPLACQTLKVCYAGADQSANCGRCEKCVRTQLNFLAAGAVNVPPCFPVTMDLDDIRNIKVHNVAQLVELTSLVDHATANNISGPWLSILQERIAAWQPTEAAQMFQQNFGGPLKRSVAKTLATIGLDEPAKKAWRSVRRSILKTVYQIVSPSRVAQLKYEVGSRVETALPLPQQSGKSTGVDPVDLS